MAIPPDQPVPPPPANARAVAPDEAYRRTFFDRHGPDGAVALRSLAYAPQILGMLAIFFALLSAKLHTSLLVKVLFVAVGASVATAGVLGAILYLGRATGDAVRVATAGGASTPYEVKFSREEALVMQGRVAEALESFEREIAAPSRNVDPIDARARAAELYAKHGNARRAAELLREVQRAPGVRPGLDIYATNRLVDLLLGPLGDRGRALVELRRLIDRYPNTTAASHARVALGKLKKDVTSG